MTTLVELTAEKHQHLRLADDCALEFARQQNIMSLRVSEISKAACSLPIFYVRDSNTGNWVLIGLTSFIQAHNLFIENGKWTALHAPHGMQTFPFFLMQSPDDSRSYTIGIDEAHPVFASQTGQPIFEASGQASLHLSKVKTLLEADIKNDIQTQQFTQRIMELNLLKPINILVQYQDGSTPSLSGLFTVDEDKLRGLATEQIADLNQKGYLIPLHAMLMSLYQLNALINKHNQAGGLSPIKNVKLEMSKNSSLS